MLNIKSGIMSFKNKLFSIGDGAPLSILSLVVIFALDILILTTIYTGLNNHTSQIVTPQKYVSGQCRNIYINQTWKKSNLASQLEPIVSAHYNRTYYGHQDIYQLLYNKDIHPVCHDLYLQFKSIIESNTMKNAFIKRKKTTEIKQKVISDFQNKKGAYDTSLLEKIADEDNTSTKNTQTSTMANEYIAQIKKINQEINAIDQRINASPLIQTLWQSIDPTSPQAKKIKSDYERFQFWYPVKKLIWQLLFLLPLFILFYLWFTRSTKKKAKIQSLVSSHLLVVASIPILIKIADTLLEIIPKHLLIRFFNLLESLNLVAIWYYLVVLAAIGAGLAAIVIIQKTIFSKERIYQKRLMSGSCYSCAKKLPKSASRICPFCGINQFKKCDHCGKETYFSGDYCIHCGEEH